MATTQAVTNVRISPRSHKLLQRLAKDANVSMQAVLDRAIEAYRREEFLRGANQDYADARRNPKAWKEILAERKAWDGANLDGLGRR